MNVIGLLVFVTLLLVVGAVIALAFSVKQADHEHADRLSLLPLEDDAGRAAVGPRIEEGSVNTGGPLRGPGETA